MEKEFVPYELAVKLKELGFDEPCIYYFNKSENNQLWQDIDSWFYRNSSVSKGNLLWGETYDNGNVSAPLWQQAFDFFIYNYGLIPIIETNGYSYIFKIQEITQYYVETVRGFETYQEARKACLEKLIEIVENETV